MIGECAEEITSAAWVILLGAGKGGVAVCTFRGARFSGTSIAAIFSGKLIKAPPVFSAWASLNALRTTSGTIAGCIISVLYFQIN
jgi:hypothetical protein